MSAPYDSEFDNLDAHDEAYLALLGRLGGIVWLAYFTCGWPTPPTQSSALPRSTTQSSALPRSTHQIDDGQHGIDAQPGLHPRAGEDLGR